jgi:NAD(P)-dependent dehydrogenase (short-subunit alcohol dehydrogenase family)
MTDTSNNRIAWITGGGTGIGLSTAKALGAAGFGVVISGRRREELDKAVATLKDSGVTAAAEQLDVSDAAAVQAAAEAILARHGRIDALVLSAGTNVPNRTWKNLTAEGFSKVTAST